MLIRKLYFVFKGKHFTDEGENSTFYQILMVINISVFS